MHKLWHCLQVIIFDPQYDAYIPLCRAHGGIPVEVKLNTEDWTVPHAGMHHTFCTYQHITNLIIS